MLLDVALNYNFRFVAYEPQAQTYFPAPPTRARRRAIILDLPAEQ